jgi:hypothetical protein
VDDPSRRDRRLVLEICREDWYGANGQRSEVIGTIEGGFDNSNQKISAREIPRDLAIRMAVMVGQRAEDLHRASLENVFRTIARNARSMIDADAASLHFARAADDSDTKLTHYIYEAWEGHHFPSVTSPRSNGLGQQAPQKRKVLFVPNKKCGHDEEYLRTFYREAYDEGMRAEAAVPIFFTEKTTEYTRMKAKMLDKKSKVCCTSGFKGCIGSQKMKSPCSSYLPVAQQRRSVGLPTIPNNVIARAGSIICSILHDLWRNIQPRLPC